MICSHIETNLAPIPWIIFGKKVLYLKMRIIFSNLVIMLLFKKYIKESLLIKRDKLELNRNIYTYLLEFFCIMQRRIQGCWNIHDGALCDNSQRLEAVNCYHGAFHRGCCSSPISASVRIFVLVTFSLCSYNKCLFNDMFLRFYEKFYNSSLL